MPGLVSVPHLSIASVIRQAPGAERIGGVTLLALPEGPGTFEAPALAESEFGPAIAAAVTRPGWRLVLGGLFVHPIDTRPGLLPRLAVAALDHLPGREAEPGGGGASAVVPEYPGVWALRPGPPPAPVRGPLVMRYRAWRQYGKAYDLVIAFGLSKAMGLSTTGWAEDALAGQPDAVLLRADGPQDEVMARILAVAIGQAATLTSEFR